MDKKEKAAKVKKQKRREMMAKIFNKVSDALKEYATPSSEKKLIKKIKKTSKSISGLVLKENK